MIDSRIRRHGNLVPLPATAWSAQVPHTGNPERRRFLAQLATVMDDRRRRIGEHAAASRLPWAVAALCPVPPDAAQRLAWEHKAAAIGTYRELAAYDSPRDPVGPEPGANNPDLRAAWHAARAALTPNHTQPGHADPQPDLTEVSRRIEELAAQRRELVARMAKRRSPNRRRRTSGIRRRTHLPAAAR